MGTDSEDSEGVGIAGNCSAGAIVWVRRRNGSWWPGRVIGADELAEPRLMSPRSGTPVKLLGRDDASVDWYNLEKSKRVKPFRCGEFDACIEKAEASYNTPIKKREKYARREDAILHALEIEKNQLERKETTAISCHADNKTLSICESGSNHCISEAGVQKKPANQKYQMSSRKITSLLDEYYLDHPVPMHRNRKVKPSMCGYENHEISTHMGVCTGPEVFKSKGKLFHSIAGRNLDITDENQSYLLPQSRHNSALITQEAIGKNSSVLKRKFLPTGSINGTAKRRDRRLPLVKVLQNSTMFPVSYSLQFHHDSTSNTMPGEEDYIGIPHDEQKDSMHSSPDADDSLDYSRYSWEHPPGDVEDACHVQQSGCMSSESTPSGWTEENEFDSSATDSELEIVEEKLRSGIAQPFKVIAEGSIESGMSRWHFKGKRNHQTITKKLHESLDEKKIGSTDKFNAQLREAFTGEFESAIFNDVLEHQFSSEKENDYDTEDDDLFTRLKNKRDGFLSQHSDFIDSDDDPHLVSQSVWVPARPPLQMWTYWEEGNLDQLHRSPFFHRVTPLLVDVDLKVQARYQGEHVPLVSLMSKLNGKAIVGHPVRIEVLDDGSTDHLLPLNESDDDHTTSLVIRTTAKRTMPRVPQSNPDPLNSYMGLAPRVKKKSIYHSHRSASGRFQRKSLKTDNLSSSQKTRSLSSFVPEKKLNTESVLCSSLIKPDRSIPTVTCIPIKVVFSRILESIGRPYSAVARPSVAVGAAEKGSSKAIFSSPS